MGIHQKEHFIDTFGVPEFFATTVAEIEDAGGGNVRQINCVARHGVLIPVCCVIRPAASVLASAPPLLEFCHKLLRSSGVAH